MSSCIVVKHQRVSIWGLPSQIDGLRIAHLSDLHLSAWGPVYARTRQLLTGLQYDLLAVTGDFSDHPSRWRKTAECCRRLFEPLRPPLGIYAVLGNHDDRRLGRVTDLPLTWLNDESVVPPGGPGRLRVAGICQDAPGAGSITRALAEAGEGEAVIMLTHYPSAIYDVPAGRVQLLLAGHTHGGQVRFPLLGALWTNDRLPRRMARGLHLVGKTWLHVNPGIGVSLPLPARLMCPREITVLELRRVEATTDHRQAVGASTHVSDNFPRQREAEESPSGAACPAGRTGVG